MQRSLNRILDPDFVSRLKSLDLKAEFILEGTLSGRHSSPFHGFSAEFAQYRSYNPGDDLKHLDWKVMGKSDRLVIKQFQDETNTRVYLIVDSSRSMAYPPKGVDKLEYSTVLAAALTLLSHQQRDAVSLAYGSDDLAGFLPPSNTMAQVRNIFGRLEALQGTGATNLSRLLEKISPTLKSGSISFLFTDLWDDKQNIANAIKNMRFRHQSLNLVHIVTPQEEAFLEGVNVEIEDLEHGEKIRLSPRHVRTAYREALEHHHRAIRAECHNLRVHYLKLTTTTPYDRALKLLLRSI